METFAKNFAELRQFGQCSNVVLNRIGPKDIVKYETLKDIILRMAHESGLTQSDKCPHEWNQWPDNFGLPSIKKSENETKATRAFVTELALATNKLKSTSTYDENKQAISANQKPAPWSSSRTNSENSTSDSFNSSHKRLLELTNAQMAGMKAKDVIFRLMSGCHNIDHLSHEQKTKLLKHLNDKLHYWWNNFWKKSQHVANLSADLVEGMQALEEDSKPEDIDASFEKATALLQEILTVTVSDELSSVTEETAMSVEEKERHEALVERCCAETPKGESYRALFSNSSSKVLAEHLDNVVNNPQDFCDG